MKMTAFLTCAAALCTVTAPAAYAGTISAEVRFGDIRGGNKPDSTEYRVEYAAPMGDALVYGAELQVKQAANAGPLGAKVSGKLGPRLPDVLGFKSQAYAELGYNIKQANNFMFWGAGVKVRHSLVGPVDINAGYRHRAAFDNISRMNENRLNAGLNLRVGSGNDIGVSYYRTTGTTRSDEIGVSFNHTF